jgi:hypothetical protein
MMGLDQTQTSTRQLKLTSQAPIKRALRNLGDQLRPLAPSQQVRKKHDRAQLGVAFFAHCVARG